MLVGTALAVIVPEGVQTLIHAYTSTTLKSTTINEEGDHEHDHHKEHVHAHPNRKGIVTFWSLFIVFALGPCEPLIPMLMVPAFAHDWALVWQVTGVFAGVTIVTMVGMSMIGAFTQRKRSEPSPSCRMRSSTRSPQARS